MNLILAHWFSLDSFGFSGQTSKLSGTVDKFFHFLLFKALT